jgi:putative DNA primase/helicase
VAAIDFHEGAAMIDKPKTYNGDLTKLPPALLPLTKEQRWVTWRWEIVRKKDGTEKWTKEPYQTRYYNEHARSNDPSTWGAYAVAIVLAGHADGIGYMLKGSIFCAVDLDRVRDLETGAIVPWAKEIQTESNGAYCEVTVSGGGLRIIIRRAVGPKLHRKFIFDRRTGAGVELYRDAERFITVSGLEIGDCNELPPADAFLDTLFANCERNGKAGPNPKSNDRNPLDFKDAGPQSGVDTDYEDIVRNGAPEGQRSNMFQAVVWHLANKGWTPEQITEELDKHPNGIKQKYATRLRSEVERSYEKWRQTKQATATGSTTTSNSWPQIRVISGELPRVVNEAEEALLTCGREIYQPADCWCVQYSLNSKRRKTAKRGAGV